MPPTRLAYMLLTFNCHAKRETASRSRRQIAVLRIVDCVCGVLERLHGIHLPFVAEILRGLVVDVLGDALAAPS